MICRTVILNQNINRKMITYLSPNSKIRDVGTLFVVAKAEIVHYDTCALSSPLLHGVKLGPSLRSGPNFTPCYGLLKTLVSCNIINN